MTDSEFDRLMAASSLGTPEAQALIARSSPEVAERVRYLGVHMSHCCSKHGCKYGDHACPVQQGLVAQTYPCEVCQDTDRWLEETVRENPEEVAEILRQMGYTVGKPGD